MLTKLSLDFAILLNIKLIDELRKKQSGLTGSPGYHFTVKMLIDCYFAYAVVGLIRNIHSPRAVNSNAS